MSVKEREEVSSTSRGIAFLDSLQESDIGETFFEDEYTFFQMVVTLY